MREGVDDDSDTDLNTSNFSLLPFSAEATVNLVSLGVTTQNTATQAFESKTG